MPLNLCLFDYESALEFAFDKEVKMKKSEMNINTIQLFL
jgi:hypothetical protein